MITLAVPLALLLLPLPLLARFLPARAATGQVMDLPDGIAAAAERAAGPERPGWSGPASALPLPSPSGWNWCPTAAPRAATS